MHSPPTTLPDHHHHHCTIHQTEKCGDEFAAHLCGVVLPPLGLPADAAQRLVFEVREGTDARSLKECLRGVLLLRAGGGGGGAGGGGAGGGGAAAAAGNGAAAR